MVADKSPLDLCEVDFGVCHSPDGTAILAKVKYRRAIKFDVHAVNMLTGWRGLG